MTRTVTGHDVGINECASVHGATTWTQQGFIGANGQDPAVEGVFDFGTASAAQSAYTALLTGMQSCQQDSRTLQTSNQTKPDATVTETAIQSYATAWQRTWTGVQGLSAPGPQTNHLYFALHGTSVICLQFTQLASTSAAPYNTSGDSGVLAMLLTGPAA